MTLLQDSVITNTLDDQPNNITESSNTLPRARWNNNRKSRLPQSRQGTIIIEGRNTEIKLLIQICQKFQSYSD